MQIQLTEQEARDLIWEQGDYFDVISGSISFTSKQVFPPSAHLPNGRTDVTFFFQSSDPYWGTNEWSMCLPNDIPNGPALLVIYRRSGSGCAWGVISMVNGAWGHAVPLLSVDLYKQSTKAQELKRLEAGTIAKAIGGGLAVGLVSALTGGFGRKAANKTVTQNAYSGSYREEGDRISATARAFMFRLCQWANTQRQSQSQTAGRL